MSNGGYRGLNSNELFVSDQFYMAYQHFVVLHINCKIFFISSLIIIRYIEPVTFVWFLNDSLP